MRDCHNTFVINEDLLVFISIYAFKHPVFTHFSMLPGKRIVRMNDCFNAHCYSPFNRLLPEPFTD